MERSAPKWVGVRVKRVEDPRYLAVLDNDIMDPTLVSGEELRGKLEGFFEVLEER